MRALPASKSGITAYPREGKKNFRIRCVPARTFVEMVRFSNPSSSSSSEAKGRKDWRYDRIDQADDEDSADEASASAVEAVEGEMDQVARNVAGLRKSDDAITCVIQFLLL